MATISPLHFAILAVVFVNTTATNYCNVESCSNKVDHTMCRFQSPNPSQMCMQWSHNGLSSAEKKAIVDKHNELRRRVASGQETRGNPGPQPAAVSMPDLTWDDELETVAQRWAIQCNFNHDSCRNVDRFAVGQNIAIMYFTGTDPSTMDSFVQMWYDEVDNFSRYEVTSYRFDPNTGHYTQLIWAETTKIGCGRIKYMSNDGWFTHYLVCNYGPSGNWIGEKIYEPI